VTDGDVGDVSDKAKAAPVIEVLRAAIERIGSKQSRIVLTIVLGLDPEFPLEGTTLTERREAAGRLFRGGSKPVKWGTIRNYHEPRALGLLTIAIADMEKQAGGDSPLVN